MTGLLTAVSALSPIRSADNKPNILYIVADDLGWKDVAVRTQDRKVP